jgi:sulfur carrier protein
MNTMEMRVPGPRVQAETPINVGFANRVVGSSADRRGLHHLPQFHPQRLPDPSQCGHLEMLRIAEHPADHDRRNPKLPATHTFASARAMMSIRMTIILNGQPFPVPDGATVLSLLEQRGLSPDRVAVELNRRLLKAQRYGEPLHEADEVEIVTFVGGG